MTSHPPVATLALEITGCVSWRSPLLLLLLLLLLPSRAAGQEGNDAGAPTDAQTDAQVAEDRAGDASRAFKAGHRLYESADYVGAIESFMRAYRLRPHHTVLCNIALCHERRDDVVRASLYYRRCLREGADKTAEAEAVENSLSRVERRVVKLDVRGALAGDIFVDGRPMGRTPSRISVNPGSHVVEVRRKGARPATVAITTRAGETRRLDLSPELIVRKPRPKKPPPPRRRLSRTWFWTAASVTAGLAIVTAVLGAQTLQIRGEYDDSPTRELRDRGLSRRLLTNIFLAGTAVAASSATVLYFFTDFGGAPNRSEEAVIGLGLRGRF